MASDAEILDRLVLRLRSKVGSVGLRVLRRDENHFAIQVGSHEDAVIGVRVKDPQRPSFSLSYPALSVKKDGSRTSKEVVSEGAVVEGVEWVCTQLAEHGMVMPEFVD